MTVLISAVTSFTKRRSRLVRMPTALPSRVTGTPEILKRAHHLERFVDSLLGPHRDRVDDHARLGALHLVDLGGLLGDREVLVDDADAAVARHADGGLVFGHRVHRRGDERRVQLDLGRQAGPEIDLVRQDRRSRGHEEHVVESQSFTDLRIDSSLFAASLRAPIRSLDRKARNTERRREMDRSARSCAPRLGLVPNARRVRDTNARRKAVAGGSSRNGAPALLELESTQESKAPVPRSRGESRVTPASRCRRIRPGGSSFNRASRPKPWRDTRRGRTRSAAQGAASGSGRDRVLPACPGPSASGPPAHPRPPRPAGTPPAAHRRRGAAAPHGRADTRSRRPPPEP